MDWSPEPLAPRTPFREVCWRLAGPSGQPVVRWIEQVAQGFEVRAEYADFPPSRILAG
jgi:hypothetical protein